jgi:biopolymer transport protein TolR
MAGGNTGASSTKSEPNVVPLCDILLVLLIIFMVVTPMIQKGANVKLPEASNLVNQHQPGELPTLYVQKNGKVKLDGQIVLDPNDRKYTLAKLPILVEEALEKITGDTAGEKKIMLKADVEVEYGKIVELISELRKAKIEDIAIITEKSTSDG